MAERKRLLLLTKNLHAKGPGIYARERSIVDKTKITIDYSLKKLNIKRSGEVDKGSEVFNLPAHTFLQVLLL